MKLYTYFRAMEIAKGRYSNALTTSGYADIAGKYYIKYSNLRDGLIKRMERIELEVLFLKDRIDNLRYESDYD